MIRYLLISGGYDYESWFSKTKLKKEFEGSNNGKSEKRQTKKPSSLAMVKKEQVG